MIVRGGRTGCKLLEVIISIVELYFDHKCKQSGAKGVCVSSLNRSKLPNHRFQVSLFLCCFVAFMLLLRVQKGSVPSSILWMMSGGCMMAAYVRASLMFLSIGACS